MRGSMKLENPESAQLSVTITMPISEWREIYRAMPAGWPHWKAASIICEAIGNACKHFTETWETR